MIKEKTVKKICEVLEITRALELDDLLIMANAVLEQTRIKSNLRGPPQVIYMNLAHRTNRRIKEGYVPEELRKRIEAAILG